ncbi:MAG: hypothetical protein ACRCSV_02940 [Chlamydiales bacterium]
MADLTLINCTLTSGAAIGGKATRGGGSGLGAGFYIDRGKTLTLSNIKIINCKAEGGSVETGNPCNGVGASFSSKNKDATHVSGGGDFPGLDYQSGGMGGASDGSTFLTGYGGARGGNNGGTGGGDGPGVDQGSTGLGGYCGGGGGGFGSGGGCPSLVNKVGCPTSPLILEGETFQVSETLIFPNPIVVKAINKLDVLDCVVLDTTDNISGSGVISKTGRGIWDHYGNCENTVDIYMAEGILRTLKHSPQKI